MNNRYRNERERHGELAPSRLDERSGWRRNEDDERSGSGSGREAAYARMDEAWHAGQSRAPQYSSDYDETYGSEWQRGNERSRGGFERDRERSQSSYGQRSQGYSQGAYGSGSYGQDAFGPREESRHGWYARGQAGNYGAGSGGGYQGGHGGSGYGGSTGTDYTPGIRGGYGASQGESYGIGGASRGSFGSSGDQGFRGRDFGSAGSDMRSSQRGGFAGRGPKGYIRTDDRICEDVCDRLSMDDDVDATEVEVRVRDGEVTLEGSVQTRSMKHRAEDLADDVPGVKDVHNRLRVIKGLLNELKDKVTGSEEQSHYANTGTKSTPGAGSSQTANGRA
jgi:osmotically-inducible protein OsmY